MIQLLEKHRDLLAELVVANTDVLGRSSGPTGKQVPFGCVSSLELLHALLNDYVQSTYTHWRWKKETDEAIWRTQVVVDSVNDAKEKAFSGSEYWEISSRHKGLSNILQRWYKQIDYLPPKDYYVIGAGGEEFPAPGDLIYLIAVVLEQMQYFAESNRIIFKKDSEERRLSEEWCDLAKSLRWTLEYGFERASRPDWGDKPSRLQRLFSNW